MADTHALIRTSPKGGPFIGTCTKCGIRDLPLSRAGEECVNPAGLTSGESLIATLNCLEQMRKPHAD
jgi:hypothetical protein